MAIQLPNGRNYFATATGAPGVGYRLYTYIPGTSTPKATYTTSAASVANPNPVVMDARGEAAIYWDGSYDVVLRDAADALVWGPERLEDSGDTLRDDIASTASASVGSGLSGFDANLNYAANTIGWAAKQPGISASWFTGYDATGTTDSASAITAAIAFAVAGAFKRIYLPGTPRCNSSITVSGGLTLYGDNMASCGVSFYGSHGFVATGDMVSFENMYVRSFSGAGAADPLTHVGINYSGTSGTRRNFPRLRNVYLRGWTRGLDLQYSWNAKADGVVTVNCSTGCRIYGQSVNCDIMAPSFTTIGGAGTIGLHVLPDSGNNPEGITVFGGVIGSAERGIVADSCLNLVVNGTKTDDLTGVGVTAESTSLQYIGGYIASPVGAITFNALGSPADSRCQVHGVDIRSGAGVAITIAGNHRNVKITDNNILFATSAVTLASTTDGCQVTGNYGGQTGAGAAISVDGQNHVIRDNKGDMTTPTLASRANLLLGGQATWNPGSIADDVSAVSGDIAVTGAAIGDGVIVFPPTGASPDGFIVYGYVNSASNCRIRALNASGGASTPPNGTWGVQVVKT